MILNTDLCGSLATCQNGLVFAPLSSVLKSILFNMPIVGLNSFRHDDDDDEDSKKNNEYFAGGLGSHGGGR